jgi:hypothetical protein
MVPSRKVFKDADSTGQDDPAGMSGASVAPPRSGSLDREAAGTEPESADA